jgi:signal peptidase II
LGKSDILFSNKYYLYIVIFILIDIFAKQFALSHLNEFEIQSFIPFVDLYLTFNSGIAFGFLDFDTRLLSNVLTIIGIFIVIYIFVLLKKEEDTSKKFALSMIIGGALGNILDRIPDGYVTDFLYLNTTKFSFFIFNPADAFISIGAILLIYFELFKSEHVNKS